MAAQAAQRAPVVMEPEADIISVKSIIADKPDVDIVRDYFRQEVADLGASSSESSDY